MSAMKLLVCWGDTIWSFMVLGVGGFGVLAAGGMVELARPAEVGDVPLSGLLVDANVGGGLQVGGTVE